MTPEARLAVELGARVVRSLANENDGTVEQRIQRVKGRFP
jgi:hypothetical protein